MSFAKGDTVSVHYVGKLEDGSIFDSSEDSDALEFVIGEEMLIPKFENALIGKKSGDIFEICIDPEDAYGNRDEELVIPLEKDVFDDDMELEVGMPLSIDTEEGPIEVFVKNIEKDFIIIDGNHPLSGQKLFFTITAL